VGRKQGWQYNRLGEWTVVRRYPGAGADMEARLYEAFNTRTGAPAILAAPRPGSPWQVPAPFVVRAAGAHGYLALELVQVPPAAHLPSVSVGLARLAQAMASVDTHPGAFMPPRRNPWRAHPAYVAALGAAALLALVAAPRAAQRAEPGAASGAATVQLAPAAMAMPAAQAHRPGAWAALMLPMPPKPFPGQARPDGAGKCEGRETAINGGCWVKLDAKAPCNEREYEWRGGCYLPMFPPRREDASGTP
jgi:hypothetical protein